MICAHNSMFFFFIWNGVLISNIVFDCITIQQALLRLMNLHIDDEKTSLLITAQVHIDRQFSCSQSSPTMGINLNMHCKRSTLSTFRHRKPKIKTCLSFDRPYEKAVIHWRWWLLISATHTPDVPFIISIFSIWSLSVLWNQFSLQKSTAAEQHWINQTLQIFTFQAT